MKKILIISLSIIFSVYTYGQNIALNKPVKASSAENTTFKETNAVDGNINTRWSSTFSDPQYIYVDLGNTYDITEVKLTWETALGKNFTIDISDNATTWNTIKSITNNSSKNNDFLLTGTGRYVRIFGTARATSWGYSIFEFEVYGTLHQAAPPPTTQPIYYTAKQVDSLLTPYQEMIFSLGLKDTLFFNINNKKYYILLNKQ